MARPAMMSVLRLPELRAFLLSSMLAGLAETALSVLLGVHVYELTHQALALGVLGLVEAIPAIGLVLVGGHVADRTSRLVVTTAARAGLAALVAILAVAEAHGGVALIYAVAFLVGALRAFEDPAATGLETEILPRERMLNALSVVASFSRISSLAGPVLGGVVYELIGPARTYGVIAAVLAASALCLPLGIAARPAPHLGGGGYAGMFASIREGLRYVFSSQVIVGSMALDLFAVFFGGAAGLFPVYAEDILHIGAAGVGLLRAAPAAGALASMLVTTRHPPRARAGLALHLAVAGFGVGIIVFGLSRNLYLSLAALFFVGACDGVSVVVRRAIVRMAAPDALRGRVAAVRGLFLNASNELGNFESGVAASLVGAVPAVWLGGVVTLLVAAATAKLAPKLLRLDLRAYEPVQR
jgi:MFS family permease